MGSPEFWISVLIIATFYVTFFALAYFAAAGMISFYEREPLDAAANLHACASGRDCRLDRVMVGSSPTMRCAVCSCWRQSRRFIGT